MKIIESLEKRRSYYSIGKELPVSEAQVTALVEKLAELVPDAFNMKSSRVVVALGEKQDMLWNTVYDAFGGKVALEKIDHKNRNKNSRCSLRIHVRNEVHHICIAETACSVCQSCPQAGAVEQKHGEGEQ